MRLVLVAITLCGLIWSVVGSTAAAATMQVGTSEIQVERSLCEDDARAGEADFFFEPPVALVPDAPNLPAQSSAATPVDSASSSLTGAQAFQTTGTGERCEPASPGARPDFPDGATFTLTNVGTGVEQTQGSVGSSTFFVGVAPGTYTLTDNFSGAVSAQFTVPAATSTFVQVVNYFAETANVPTPDPEGGQAFVSVFKTICIDEARADDVDFLVFNAQATADDCRNAEAGEVSFTLTADDGSTEGPTPTGANGVATFLVTPGVYTVTEVETGAVSEPVEFYPGGQGINVINYAGVAQATDTPTMTPTVPPTPDDPGKPAATDHPGPGLGATHPPASEREDATHPPVVGGTDATHPARAVATKTDVPAVVATKAAVTTLPSTGEGTVRSAPLGISALLLLGAVALITLAISAARRRTR